MTLLKTLKSKILLLLLASVSGSMLLAGIALGYFINQQYEKQAQQIFTSFYQNASSELNSIQTKMLSDISILSKNLEIIASLNLISEYATIQDYQPIIYDKEKWGIAERLSNYARAANVDHIRIHDKKGWLVSFVDNEEEHLEEGILSYKNRKPVFKTLSIKDGTHYDMPKHNHWHNLYKQDILENKLGTRLIKDINNEIYIQSSHPIYRIFPDKTKKYIGMIFASKKLTSGYLTSLTRQNKFLHKVIVGDDLAAKELEYSVHGEHLLNSSELLGNNSQKIHWLTTSNNYISIRHLILNDNTKLYIISSLDRTIPKQQITDTSFLVLFVFLVSAISIITIGVLFSRRSITLPMEKLLQHAEQLSSGDYNEKQLTTGTREFDKLATTLNEAADTIHSREDELRSANIEMEVRVQSRTSELQKTNEDLANEMTVRESIEDRLRESKEMLQMIMDNIPQFIFWKDTESHYLGCNKNFLKTTGFDNEVELLGKSDYDMPWSKEEADFYRLCDQRIMQTDTPEFHIQETLTTLSGDMIYLDTNKIPLHDNKGAVIGILGTFEDITERKKADLHILQAKEIAETANSAKSDFLSRMSHELRTPLNAILGFAQLLEFDISHPLDAEQKQSVDEILTAGHHLLELINDILDLSKIETGELTLTIRSLSLQTIINEALNLVKNFAGQKEITLNTSNIDIHDINVLADPVRIKQAMLNLLNNAIKYNRPKGSVTLDVEKLDGSYIKIIIADTGIGIDKEFQDRVFTPFDRLGADARAIDGTGIGLVITKQLIELMHGEIGFTSHPDTGSIFWITLPVSTSQSAYNEPDHISDANLIAANIPQHNKKIILCVEDNDANLRLIENIITTKTPYELVSAKTAEEGIELIQHITPDLILMDITLPGMDGIEATRIIKHHKDFKEVPIIAISANAMLKDIQNGLDTGFSDYLTKPIDIGLLLEAIQKSIN